MVRQRQLGSSLYVEVKKENLTFAVIFCVLIFLTHDEFKPDEDGGGVWVVVEIVLLGGATGGGRVICAVAVPVANPSIWKSESCETIGVPAG